MSMFTITFIHLADAFIQIDLSRGLMFNLSAFLDINLAGEPKPHRSKTIKRSAGDMYRFAFYIIFLFYIVCVEVFTFNSLPSPTVLRLIWTMTFREITMTGERSLLKDSCTVKVIKRFFSLFIKDF